MKRVFFILTITLCFLHSCNNESVTTDYTITTIPSSNEILKIDSDGGVVSITISGTSVWSAKTEDSFVSLSKQKGGSYGNKFSETIQVKVEPNPTVSVRKAKILIYNDDDDSLVAAYHIEQSLNEHEMNKYEAVDLGLSVKWASQNLDISSNTSIQGLYGWGDPTGCLTGASGNYANGINTVISGTEYDVVTQAWGRVWRIPTKEEFQELYDKCTWKYEDKEGKKGFTVTGKNGNHIFIPILGLREGNQVIDNPVDDGIGSHLCPGCFPNKTADDHFFGKWNHSMIYWTGSNCEDLDSASAIIICETGEVWHKEDENPGVFSKNDFYYKITNKHSISFVEKKRHTGLAIRPVRSK